MRVEMHSRSVPSDVLSFGTADKDSMDAPLLNPVGEDSPRRHLKSPHFVIPSLVGAVSCALLFCTGMVMTGRPYAEPCVGYQYTVCQYTGCYTVGQFFGTLFAIVAIPPALLALGWLPQVRH